MKRRFDYPAGLTAAEIKRIYNKWYQQTHPQIYRDATKRYKARNLQKVLELRKRWMLKNPDRMKAIYKKASKKCNEKYPGRGWVYVLRTKFGLTVEQYNEMLKSQNGVCAICQSNPHEGYRKLAVDHCHTTNKIRGLLCSFCNVVLGTCKDNPTLLETAAAYLRRHQ